MRSISLIMVISQHPLHFTLDSGDLATSSSLHPRFSLQNPDSTPSGGRSPTPVNSNRHESIFGEQEPKKALVSSTSIPTRLRSATSSSHSPHPTHPPAQQPFPFQSAADHNRLGLFVLSLTRSCDDFVEPQLDDLINHLKTVCSLVGDWLSELLVSSLTALLTLDDLFNFFFEKLRGAVMTADCMNIEDDQIFLDPNSHFGVFLWCCILAFNMPSFDGIYHIMTNIATYCNSTDSMYELPEEDLNDMVE